MKRKVIGIGGTAEVVEWEDDKVLKLFFVETQEEVVKWEFNRYIALQKAGVPSTRVYGIVKEDDRYGIIMEKIIGQSLLELIFKCMNTGETDEIYKHIPGVARLLKNVHTHNSDVGDTMAKSLKRSLKRADYLSKEDKSKLYNIIESLPNPTCVCHGDPNFGNVILTKNGYRLIDWMNSLNGHPYYDIADYVSGINYGYLSTIVPEKLKTPIKETGKYLNQIFIKEYGLSDSNTKLFEKFYLMSLLSKLGGSSTDEVKRIVTNDVKVLLSNY